MTYSRNGRGKLETLRNGASPRAGVHLKGMLVGRFDGGSRARILSLNGGDRLVMWSGATNDNQFTTRSAQKCGDGSPQSSV